MSNNVTATVQLWIIGLLDDANAEVKVLRPLAATTLDKLLLHSYQEQHLNGDMFTGLIAYKCVRLSLYESNLSKDHNMLSQDIRISLMILLILAEETCRTSGFRLIRYFASGISPSPLVTSHLTRKRLVRDPASTQVFGLVLL
jgi:hypothetical protein